MKSCSRYIVGAVVGLALWLAAPMAGACQFNTDCSPGNKYDSKPVGAPLDLNRTYGNTCNFNTDCGPGSACVKGGGSIAPAQEVTAGSFPGSIKLPGTNTSFKGSGYVKADIHWTSGTCMKSR